MKVDLKSNVENISTIENYVNCLLTFTRRRFLRFFDRIYSIYEVLIMKRTSAKWIKELPN